MARYELSEICKKLDEEYILSGAAETVHVENITTPYAADERSLVFISPSRTDKQEMVERTKAAVIICDQSLNHFSLNKCFIIVKNPKYTFAKLAKIFFTETLPNNIHPTAIIHPEAVIPKDVYIGPHVYIGKCVLKSNTVIHGNCYLYDNVLIGENVIIHAGCIIGADGCGHIKDKDGIYHAFPHIGRVVIESNVVVGAHSCIAKGALSDTVIKQGTIIDSFVQVGHNVVVEENVLILANSVIGGSSIVRKNTVLAIGVHICDYVTIGENAHIGPGVTIMKDVAPYAKVVQRAPLTLSQAEWKEK